jgi:hypothetical protein
MVGKAVAGGGPARCGPPCACGARQRFFFFFFFGRRPVVLVSFLTRRANSLLFQAGLAFMMVPGKIMGLHYQHNRIR